MDFTEACHTLRMWIEDSDGQSITLASGKQSCFFSLETYEEEDLKRIEADFEFVLPEPYRYLMLTVGAAVLFDSEANPTSRIEFHQLDEIRQKHPSWITDPQDIFTRFLPIAVDQGLSEVAMFLLKGSEPHNFLVTSQESAPEGWDNMGEEPKLYSTLESWLMEMVETEGQMQRH